MLLSREAMRAEKLRRMQLGSLLHRLHQHPVHRSQSPEDLSLILILILTRQRPEQRMQQGYNIQQQLMLRSTKHQQQSQ
jgi:hypothetical protein